MAEILEILDKGQILTDIDAVITGITKLEEKITEASNKILTVKVDLQGAESLEALTAATKQYQQAVQDLGVAQKQNIEVEKQKIALSEQYEVSLTENAETLAYLKLDLKNTENAIRGLNAQILAGTGNQEKLTQRLIEQTEAQVVLRQAINTTTAEMRKQTDIGLDKQMRKDAIAADKHAQSQIGLYNTLASVRKEMVKLEMSGQKMGAEYAALTVRARQLSQAQIEVNNETKGSLSLFTRFGDLFERMGLRIVASLVWWGALGAALAAVYEWMTKLSDKEQAVADGLKKMEDATKSFNDTVATSRERLAASTEQEAIELENLITMYNRISTASDERIKVYNRLQSLYPNILQNLTDEEQKTQIVSEAHENQMKKLREYMVLRQQFKESEKQVSAAVTKKEEDKTLISSLDENMPQGAKRVVEFLKKKPDASNDEILSNVSGMGAAQGGGIRGSKFIEPAREYIKALNDIKQKEDLITIEKGNQYAIEKQIIGLENLPEKKEKTKKPPKDNAKNLEAELAAEKEHYKIRQELDQREYDLSRKTFTEQQEFDERKKQAALEHATEMLDIIRKYHRQVGESEAKYTARQAAVIADQFAVDNAANEDERKIAEEIQKRHIKAEKDVDDLIKKLTDERDKIRDINREIDEINAASLAHKERANGISPFLEAIGFDADFQENMDAFDRQIKATKEKRADLDDKLSRTIGTGSGVEVGKVQGEIANSDKDLAQLEADKQKAIDDKKIEGKKKAAELTIELAKTTFDAIKQITEQQFAWEQRQLDIKMEQIRLQSEQQMQAIDATAGFQIDKDNQKAKVAAQTASAERDIQAKSNALKLRQARFEKESAEMSIITKTSQAIVSTIAAYAPIVGGMAIAAPIIALEAAIGAAEYAVAASQPLPQFEDGGVTATTHFIAAEGNKPELIIAPSGETSIASKEGVYSAPIGSTVKNASDTEKMLKYAINGIGINAMSMGALQEQRVKQMTDKRIVEELQDVKAEIMRAAYVGRVIKNEVVIKGSDLQRPTRH